jgi:hypothetical protein
MKQIDFILKRLKEKGEITRNECLRNYISRLSARIYDLRQAGWDFEAFYRPVFDNKGNKIGRDYVYKVVKVGNDRIECSE